MNSVAAVFTSTGKPGETTALQFLGKCESITRKALVVTHEKVPPGKHEKTITVDGLWSKSAVVAVLKWFEATAAEYLLWIGPGAPILNPAGLQRLLSCAEDTGAAIVYGDYAEQDKDGPVRYHPLIDYQLGSLRDDFDFGPVLLLSRAGLSGLLKEIESDTPDLQFGALYDLRLRLTERGAVYHLSEPVYLLPVANEQEEGESHFKYVDPKNRAYQIEMEKVATEHLRRINAFLGPRAALPLADDCDYPVKASIIIPVRDRASTIVDAVKSALAQEASFDFNVIVIDNHSADGTTKLLAEIAGEDHRLIHYVPERTDLGIGGCWQEAISSTKCGRIAVQLDSDDLFDGNKVLQRIVAEFDKEPYAAVIGSYTTVNFDLEELPPGLIDHREWSDSNGHNNALRIAGLGAPRAFHVPTLRSLGLPNVSYGEDYAVVLRLSRTYQIGRIYDSLYWCRRWEGNTDSALSLETSNRYAAYKDRIRTIEIIARQRQNHG